MILSIAGFKEHLILRKRFYLVAAKLIFGTALVSFIIVNVKPEVILTAITGADKTLLLTCLLLMPVNLFLQFYKWKIACAKLLDVQEKKPVVVSLFYGLAAGSFTPARVGEYWGRSLAFNDKSFLHVTTATVIDKIFPLIIILIFGFFSSLIMMNVGSEYKISLALLAGGIIIPIFILLLLSGTPVRAALLKFLSRFSFINSKPEVIESLKTIEKKFLFKMGAISLLLYLCYVTQYAILVAAFSHNPHLLKFIIAGMVVMFSKTMLGSLSFSELGIREGASVYLLTVIGETAATGFNSAIFLFLINVAVPSLAGLILLFRRKNGK